jgi:hypothetical protein
MNMLEMMMDQLEYMKTNNVMLDVLVHSNQHHMELECLILMTLMMMLMMVK